jgi:hypothetical protein
MAEPLTIDIADMAIHPVVCQKSAFQRNSGFQNSLKLDLLQIPAKNFMTIFASFAKIFWCQKFSHGALQK